MCKLLLPPHLGTSSLARNACAEGLSLCKFGGEHALLAQPALVFLFGWCTCQGGSGIDVYVSNASGYAFQMVPSVCAHRPILASCYLERMHDLLG